MKTCIQLVIILMIPASLYAQSDTLRFMQEGNGSDSVEYELIVMDVGYDSYLATQANMNFYSQSYYEQWNALYVLEWNARYLQPLVYGGIYEVYIDYRDDIDYGLELNYRLYHYFRFFERENNVKLYPR